MGTVVKLREEAKHVSHMPYRRPNAELRTREFLTETEVEQLIEAANSTIRSKPQSPRSRRGLLPR